jgi:hypothetical protein
VCVVVQHDWPLCGEYVDKRHTVHLGMDGDISCPKRKQSDSQHPFQDPRVSVLSAASRAGKYGGSTPPPGARGGSVKYGPAIDARAGPPDGMALHCSVLNCSVI